MAYTTIHQLRLVGEYLSELPRDCFKELRFESVMDTPSEELGHLCAWLKVKRLDFQFESTIDINRAQQPKTIYSKDRVARVRAILEEIRMSLGYLN